MFIKQLVVGQVSTNCYITGADESSECVVIDPGDNASDIIYEAGKAGRSIVAVLLTHGHFDHISGLEDIKKNNQSVIVYAYEAEKEMLRNLSLNLTKGTGKPLEVNADIYNKDGDILSVAGLKFEVLYTPGHTSGSVCYYVESEKVLFSGDTLFEMSVGRTDFPTGSGSAIVKSVKERLYVLPDDVKVYPGHGNETSIGYEKQYNMFV